MKREWDYELIEDMLQDPRYVKTNSAKAGMRSLIMIPVRLESQVRGWVNFFSREPRRFTPDEVTVARRIAAHIVLALSHQRLAEQARRTEELRARTTNLELLDELLAALVDSGDTARVFGRISAIAGKVLPHDALALMVRLPDGRHARVYASSGFGSCRSPRSTEVPEELLAESGLGARHLRRSVRASTDAALRQRLVGHRVSSRCSGCRSGSKDEFAGALMFLSRTRAALQPADVPVARRMADRHGGDAGARARDRGVEDAPTRRPRARRSSKRACAR